MAFANEMAEVFYIFPPALRRTNAHLEFDIIIVPACPVFVADSTGSN